MSASTGQKTDAWGIPVLHVETQYTDNEVNMASDAVDTMSEVCRDGGFEVLATKQHAKSAGLFHS